MTLTLDFLSPYKFSPMRLLLPLFAFLLSFLSVSAQTYSVSASVGTCGSPSSTCQCDQNSSTTITDPDGAVRAQIRTYNSDQNVEIRFSKPPGGAEFFKCNARIRIYDAADANDPIVNEFVTLRCENDSQFDVEIPSNFLPNSNGSSKTYLVAFDNNPTGSGTDCSGNSCTSTGCAVPLVSGQNNDQIVLSSFEVTRDGSQSSGPDLAVTRIFLDDNTPAAGESNRMNVEFENISTFLLTDIDVLYKINGVVVGGDSHSSLSPGSSRIEDRGYDFECGGSYTLCVEVNPSENDIDLTSNELCRTYFVSSVDPDISVELSTVPSSPVTTGEEVRLVADFQSNGGLTAEDVDVNFRIDGTTIESFNLGNFAPNTGTITRNVFHTFPNDGEYDFTVEISFTDCSNDDYDEISSPLEIQVNDPTTPAELTIPVNEYFISENTTASNNANVLFLYSTAGLVFHPGNLDDLIDDIGSQVDGANIAFQESGLDLAITIADILPLNYPGESGDPRAMLIELLDPNDGVLDDELILLQEAYAADIIFIVTGPLVGAGGVSCYTGISSNPAFDAIRCSGVLNISLGEGDELAITRNLLTNSGGSFIVAHEIAHVFGAGHYEHMVPGAFPTTALGDVSSDSLLRTIMTYGDFAPTSITSPVFSGDHNYPGGSSMNAGSAEGRDNSSVIESNMNTVTSHSSNRVLVSNTGEQELIIQNINTSSSWLDFPDVSFPLSLSGGEEISLPFTVNWDFVGATESQATVSFIANVPTDEITITARPTEVSAANFSTFSTSVVASLVKNAEVSVFRDGATELCGYTNSVGEIVCTTTPALKAGDQLQITANGYEAMSITLTEEMVNASRLSLPVVENQNTSLPLNPYLKIVSDRFTSGPSVTVSAGASANLNQTQVRSNGGGWQTISPGSSIALPLIDGSNNIEARLTGPGGNSIVSEQVLKLPASDIVNATINVPADLEGACFYASNLLITDLTSGSNSVNLPRTAIDYVFKKMGYLDTKVDLYAPTTPYSLSMTPRLDFDGSKTLSGFASQNVQFAERGVSVKYLGSSSLMVTREDASFSDPSIIPYTQTVEVTKSSSDQIPILLKVSYDQIQEFNLNDASVLVEKNGDLFEVTPADFGDSITVDDVNQVLTFTNLKGGERVTIIENASFLPVDLIYFNGSISDKGISTLSWESASEEAFSHYELQHSTDASQFEFIARVSTQGERQYSQTHSSVVGVNFYRLKMVDLDGTFQYSNIVQLNNDGSGLTPEINIYPNPANRVLNLLLPENVEIDAVSVVNADGRLVLKRESVGASSLSLDISLLPAGTYFVRVNSGSTLYNNKFIKK